MKKIYLFVIFCFLSKMYSQEKFIFNKDGFTDYVVVEINQNSSELYSKTINWIKETYKDPDNVIKMTIVNDKIRIYAYTNELISYNVGKKKVNNDSYYTIEVSFKEGKYKFDPTELKISNPMGSSTGLLDGRSLYYDEKGKLPKGFEEIPTKFETFFNNLNESLKNYLEGNYKSKSSDW
ncbi:hypothetical protein [Flavobacterium sp. U410]